MPPPQFPPSQIYLIYGNNEAEVSDTRYRLVTSLLTPEERDSGLTEIQSPGNMPLKLDTAMAQIVEELGTSSFLGDSRRVVVIHDLQDFYAAKRTAAKKGKKKAPTESTRMDTFTSWLKDVLPTTSNIAIFVCQENEEKQKTVSQESPLYDFIRRNGHLIERREKPLQYEFENHLLAANGPAAITLLREWLRRIGSDSTARLRIYQTLSGVVDLVIQARCSAEGKKMGVPPSHLSVQRFPSLDKLPSWKADKITKLAGRYSEKQLKEILGDLNRLQTIMYPSGEEAYVPSWEDHLELAVVRMTMGSR